MGLAAQVPVVVQTMVKPYRNHALQSALSEYRWADAGDLTREALYDSSFDRAAINELDRMWRAASDDHFGFSVQPGLVGVRPPRGHGIATHRYVDAVACACGWRGWNHWRALEDSPRSEQFFFVPPIPRHGPPQSFSRGLFPLYDVVASDPERAFTPRDAYGDLYWDLLCEVWHAVLLPNARRTPGTGPCPSDAALLRTLASELATSGVHHWRGPTVALVELMRQKQLVSLSVEDLAFFKGHMPTVEVSGTRAEVWSRIRAWVESNEGAG